MPMLPCPHCSHSIEVPLSRAGGAVDCAQCGQTVAVPKLGELRRISAEAMSASDLRAAADARRETASAAGPGLGSRLAFVGSLAVAAVALLVASFCFVRYWTLDPGATTESHIAEIEEVYPQLPPGQLVREWQQMESISFDVVGPHYYHVLAIEKAGWMRKGLIGVGIAAVGILTAAAIIVFKPKATTAV